MAGQTGSNDRPKHLYSYKSILYLTYMLPSQKPSNEWRETIILNRRFWLLTFCLVVFCFLFSPIVTSILSAGKGSFNFVSEPSTGSQFDRIGVVMNLQNYPEQDAVKVLIDERVLGTWLTRENTTFFIQNQNKTGSIVDGVCPHLLYISTSQIIIVEPPEILSTPSLPSEESSILAPERALHRTAHLLSNDCVTNPTHNNFEIVPISENGQINKEFSLINDVTPYLFPFDSRSLDLFFSVRLEQGDNNLPEESRTTISYIAPRILAFMDSQEWVSEVYFTLQEEGVIEPKPPQPIPVSPQAFTMRPATATSSPPDIFIPSQMKMHIELTRPFSSKLLTIVILSFVAAAIVLLIKIDDLGNFLEVATAILLGLWGVQEVLIPDYIITTTIVHTLILALYTLFAFALFIRFVIKPFWYGYSFQEFEEISNENQTKETANHDIIKIEETEDATLLQNFNYLPQQKMSERFVYLIVVSLSVLFALISWLKFTKK